MLTILLPALMLGAAPAVPPPQDVAPRSNVPDFAPDGRRCLNAKHQQAEFKAQPRGSKLAELPAGDVHLTVVRHIGRCQVSTIVRYGVGETGSAGAPLQR